MVLPGVRRDLVTATAAVAGFSSFAFGILTNLPVALAQVSLVHPVSFNGSFPTRIGPVVLTFP